jgi:hypothetical protein
MTIASAILARALPDISYTELMKHILCLILVSIFWGATSYAETVLYHNDFSGTTLPTGFNYVSPAWSISNGALVGTGSIQLDGPPSQWDCPSSATSIDPVLCRCIAYCDTRYQHISAIAVKGNLATPQRHAVRVGFIFPIRSGFSGRTCPITNASTPMPMVLLDYVDIRNYKWVQLFPSYDCFTDKTNLYGVIGQTINGARSTLRWERMGELNATAGRAAVALQINGPGLRLFVNGVLRMSQTFSDPINSGKVGLMNEQPNSVRYEYLTILGMP